MPSATRMSSQRPDSLLVTKLTSQTIRLRMCFYLCLSGFFQAAVMRKGDFYVCLSVPTTPGTTAEKEESVKNECKYAHLYQVISPETSHGQCLGSTAQKLLVQVTPRGRSHRTSHLGQNMGHQDPTQV